MAKDDYYVIAYKVLVYLYAHKKRKIVFNEAALRKAAGAEKFDEAYFEDVLRMMQEEELITGLDFTRAWGAVWMRLSDMSAMEITSKGILFLTENSRAASIKKMLMDTVDVVADLIGIVGL